MFFRTTRFQLNFLKLIEFPNILHWKSDKNSNWVWSWSKIWAKLCPLLWKKVKKQTISLGFFHILLEDYLLKQEEVVAKTHEWKFMAIIGRNAKFYGCEGQIFAWFWSKMAKKLIILNNFILVSKPWVTKLIII